ncbi:Os12g0558650 [Oryza sativa Japonica Group]|uniref:Os12g0558650 protein n=1 Tax=Oryza sativa subsp. japonica TaxID=39947 RepID=A0A0P0YB96_ORYSJ|nr:Os12g0558650 [Oryza sativa Japonica Group]
MLAAAAVTGDRRKWGGDRATSARGVRARLAHVRPLPRAIWEACRRRDRRPTRLARARPAGALPSRRGQGGARSRGSPLQVIEVRNYMSGSGGVDPRSPPDNTVRAASRIMGMAKIE